MRIVADMHLHFYPCYDVNAALRNLSSNLAKLAGDAVKAGFLAERNDCSFFSDLRNGKIHPDADFGGAGTSSRRSRPTALQTENANDSSGGRLASAAAGCRNEPNLTTVNTNLEVKPAPEPEALILRGMNTDKLLLFAGRQIVTAERIEILALTCDAQIPYGLPADETVRAILNAGGIPVLSWAPGKWFFERGKVVRRLVGQFEAGQILIGDTSLRPTIWPEPLLVTEARKKGLRIVAGSDPLPFPGEEKYCGTYGTILEGAFDELAPVDSIRKLLVSPATTISPAGKRCGAAEVALRLLRNAMAKRATG